MEVETSSGEILAATPLLASLSAERSLEFILESRFCSCMLSFVSMRCKNSVSSVVVLSGEEGPSCLLSDADVVVPFRARFFPDTFVEE